MRKEIYLLLFILFIFCDNPTSHITEEGKEKASKNYDNLKNNAIMEFEKKEHDFGETQNGKTYVYNFKFKNKGKLPLVIFNVKATCGCTIPEYSNHPINSGEEGFIKVSFTPNGSGYQSKSITVITNSVVPEDQISIKSNNK